MRNESEVYTNESLFILKPEKSVKHLLIKEMNNHKYRGNMRRIS